MSGELVTAEKIGEEVAGVIVAAGQITLESAAQYESAADFLKAVKGAQKRVEDHFAGMKAAAHKAWKAVTGKEADIMRPLVNAEATVKKKMLAYAQEQERIRQAEQARINAENEAAAAAARAKLEREAAKLKTPELREARLEQAAAIVAPVVELAPVTPVVKGQAIRKTFKAVVVNVSILPREYMLPNQQMLDAVARSTKGAIAIPGVEFKEEFGMSSTGR